MSARNGAAALRAAVEGIAHQGRRFPAALRQRLIAYAQRRLDEGAGKNEVARELGVSATSVGRWQQRGFVPVQVVERRPSAAAISESAVRLIVDGPCGLRIEGLTVEQLAELIRGLS